LPFSAGRRACIGEKLAMTDLFLIQVRLIQKTRRLGSFQLIKDGRSKEDLYGNPERIVIYSAADYAMKLALTSL